MILLLLFRFRQLFERAMLKPKLQILRCAHAQKQMGRIYIYIIRMPLKIIQKNRGFLVRDFFGWVKIWKSM